MFIRHGCVVALLAVFLGTGCSAQAPPGMKMATEAPAAKAVVAQAPMAPPAGAGGDAKPVVVEANLERKIIFNGTLDVEVKDYAAAYKELSSAMQKHKAFFTKTEVRGDSGQKRVGQFTIKVPVESFQQLVESLAAVGNPIRNTTDSQDVTEEFVDVAARVKNFKAEEEVLNKLLKEAGTRLDDVFKIREQIRVNREQIERAEGRLNVLAKLTSLSTITLTLRDKEEYVAPTAAKVTEPESFGNRASGTFASSLSLLRQCAEGVSLFAIAVAPWLPLAAVVIGLVWYTRKRMRLAAAS